MTGTLDATGSATAQVLLPPDPSLSGIRFVMAGVALGPGGSTFAEISPWTAVTLP
jgi:hypothetical protein